MGKMNEKIVLITGGTSGYGKATAKKLVEEGAIVIITARKQEELEQSKVDTGCADIIKMDVTKFDDWKMTYDFVMEKYGRLDVLVNNAGGGVAIREVTEQTKEDIDKVIQLNLNSTIYGANVFAPLMKEQGSGTIINLSSVCAKEAWPGWSVYASAKWGVLGFSKGLYVELRPYNVRVTCLIPASCSTGFQKNAQIGEVVNKLQPEDIADSIAYICELPEHAVVEELTVWGIDQEVNPL